VYADGIGNLDFEEGSRICFIQDVDGNQWEDLVGIYRSIMFYKIEEAKGLSFLREGGVTHVTG